MKSAATFAFLAIFGGSALTALAQHQKEPVDYVSPNIGGIGQLLTPTIPYVQRPHGMARLARSPPRESPTAILPIRYMVFLRVQRS